MPLIVRYAIILSNTNEDSLVSVGRAFSISEMLTCESTWVSDSLRYSMQSPLDGAGRVPGVCTCSPVRARPPLLDLEPEYVLAPPYWTWSLRGQGLCCIRFYALRIWPESISDWNVYLNTAGWPLLTRWPFSQTHNQKADWSMFLFFQVPISEKPWPSQLLFSSGGVFFLVPLLRSLALWDKIWMMANCNWQSFFCF